MALSDVETDIRRVVLTVSMIVPSASKTQLHARLTNSVSNSQHSDSVQIIPLVSTCPQNRARFF